MNDANFQQRVFEAFPPYPQYVTIYYLLERFAQYDRETVRNAVTRLLGLRLLERKRPEANPATRRNVMYRLRKGARWPVDMRGHHGGSGRRSHATS